MQSIPHLAATLIVLAALAPRPAVAAQTPDVPDVPDVPDTTHAQDAQDSPGAPPVAAHAPASIAWRALEAEPPTAWTFLCADGTVHQALQRWMREAGWQLVWDVERDFPIDAEVTLHGNLLAAMNQAMAVLRDTDFPLQASIQAESRVVRIGRHLPDGARR
ncbi:TcpQ domain-containing protein [Mitsuaria sp. 7]|uniref:TcpQ domain-containing protein n=1 Tax=Mitsuaria sp. 7 TaxID=1658665 RepID=UPI000837945D|nr:TcpQ domain-containing protein [Mitsuaria sp. 7]